MESPNICIISTATTSEEFWKNGASADLEQTEQTLSDPDKAVIVIEDDGSPSRGNGDASEASKECPDKNELATDAISEGEITSSLARENDVTTSLNIIHVGNAVETLQSEIDTESSNVTVLQESGVKCNVADTTVAEISSAIDATVASDSTSESEDVEVLSISQTNVAHGAANTNVAHGAAKTNVAHGATETNVQAAAQMRPTSLSHGTSALQVIEIDSDSCATPTSQDAIANSTNQNHATVTSTNQTSPVTSTNRDASACSSDVIRVSPSPNLARQGGSWLIPLKRLKVPESLLRNAAMTTTASVSASSNPKSSKESGPFHGRKVLRVRPTVTPSAMFASATTPTVHKTNKMVAKKQIPKMVKRRGRPRKTPVTTGIIEYQEPTKADSVQMEKQQNRNTATTVLKRCRGPGRPRKKKNTLVKETMLRKLELARVTVTTSSVTVATKDSAIAIATEGDKPDLRRSVGRRCKTEQEKRPLVASDCQDLNKADKWRQQIIGEVSRKVTQIQNAGLDEMRLQELKDEINKLLREKSQWEDRIKVLGGPDYKPSVKKSVGRPAKRKTNQRKEQENDTEVKPPDPDPGNVEEDDGPKIKRSRGRPRAKAVKSVGEKNGTSRLTSTKQWPLRNKNMGEKIEKNSAGSGESNTQNDVQVLSNLADVEDNNAVKNDTVMNKTDDPVNNDTTVHIDIDAVKDDTVKNSIIDDDTVDDGTVKNNTVGTNTEYDDTVDDDLADDDESVEDDQIDDNDDDWMVSQKKKKKPSLRGRRGRGRGRLQAPDSTRETVSTPSGRGRGPGRTSVSDPIQKSTPMVTSTRGRGRGRGRPRLSQPLQKTTPTIMTLDISSQDQSDRPIASAENPGTEIGSADTAVKRGPGRPKKTTMPPLSESNPTVKRPRGRPPKMANGDDNNSAQRDYVQPTEKTNGTVQPYFSISRVESLAPGHTGASGVITPQPDYCRIDPSLGSPSILTVVTISDDSDNDDGQGLDPCTSDLRRSRNILESQSRQPIRAGLTSPSQLVPANNNTVERHISDLSCRRSSGSSSGLYTTATIFKCSFCNSSFLDAGHMEVHLRSHTEERPCRCSICGEGFTVEEALNAHRRKHASTIYECTLCGDSFSERQKLQTHCKGHIQDQINGLISTTSVGSHGDNRQLTNRRVLVPVPLPKPKSSQDIERRQTFQGEVSSSRTDAHDDRWNC